MPIGIYERGDKWRESMKKNLWSNEERNKKIGKKKKGVPLWENRPHPRGTLGMKFGEETKLKKSGANSKVWKGDKVGYIGLHIYIKRKLGKAKQCQFCKKDKGRIEWANKSHTYRRDLNDWIPLCPPCHRGFDSNFRNAITKAGLDRRK